MKGIYSCTYLDKSSSNRLYKLLDLFNIKKHVDYPLHATIVHSEVTPSRLQPLYSKIIKMRCVELFYINDFSLVIRVQSSLLDRLHNRWITRGAVNSFPNYIQHVTINCKSSIDEYNLTLISKYLKANKIFIYGKPEQYTALEL